MQIIRIAKTLPTKKNSTSPFSASSEYTAQFWTPGVVSYSDCGEGMALLRKETMDKMLPSFIGKPVIIDHTDAQPDEIKSSGQAVGEVTDVYWNPDTGWFDCKFTITDAKAKELVEGGISVSCAFNVLDAGPGGEYLAVKYNEEVTDGSFTHLALVKNPRYEDSKIFKNSRRMFLNSKGAKMVQKENASSEQQKEVESMLKKGMVDKTIMARMKEKHGLTDEQTQDILNKILFPNSKENGKYTVQIVDKGGSFMAKVFRGDDADAKAGLSSRLKGTTDVYPTESEAQEAAKELMNEKKNDISGDFGSLMREIKEQLYQIAQALGHKFSGKENAKETQLENGYRLKISPINDKFVGVIYKDEAQVESTMQHGSEDDVHKEALGIVQKFKGKENSGKSNENKTNGILRVSKKNSSDTNAGRSKMFGWFKKKKNSVEDEAQKKAKDEAALKAQEAAKEMKENGEQVNLAEQMVEIEGEQVSLADLIKTYQAEQAEKAAMAENAVPEETMSPDEEIADEAGNVYKLGDLVNSYSEKKAKLNAEAEAKAEADKKAAEEAAKGKENETDEEKELRIKKENEKAEADKAEKEKADAEAKAKENSKGAKKDIKFFKKLNSLKDSATEIRENGIETLKDKIARGKSKYGSKKK